MYASVHEPGSMLFFSLLVLGQIGCLAVHAAFLESTLKLKRMADYAHSLQRYLGSHEEPMNLNVEEYRKEAELRKRLLEDVLEQQASLVWIAVESKHKNAYSDRMAR